MTATASQKRKPQHTGLTSSRVLVQGYHFQPSGVRILRPKMAAPRASPHSPQQAHGQATPSSEVEDAGTPPVRAQCHLRCLWESRGSSGDLHGLVNTPASADTSSQTRKEEHTGSWQDATSLSPDPTRTRGSDFTSQNAETQTAPGLDTHRQLHDVTDPASFSAVLPAFPSCRQHSCPAQSTTTSHLNSQRREGASPSPHSPLLLKEEEKFPRSPQQPHWAICVT